MVTALNLIGHDKSLQDHWIRRFVAFLIDAIIFAIVTWIILVALSTSIGWGYGFGGGLLFGCLFFLYSAIMELYSGATLGKNFMKLKVISLHGQLNSEGAFLRNISKVFWLILLLDWLVGFITEGDPKQRWLDRYAGTTVIVTGALTHEQQHTYQSQQSGYAPPPQEQYASQDSTAYQYPQEQQPQPSAPEQEAPEEQTCKDCGGRLVLTGSGRMQCIRCGRIF